MVENVYNSRERLGELDLQSTASQQSDGCILLYMAIAGALFDVTRPALASAVEMYVDPSMCQFRPLTLAANGGALLLGLVLSSLKKLSQSVLYPVLGAVFAAVGVVIFTFVEASIISLVWHGAMGAVTVTVFLGRDFVAQTQRLSERIEVGDDLVQHLRDDTWRVLRLTAQFLVAFGAVTGVAMTILFQGDFGGAGNKKVLAAQMAVGFGLCAIALYVWIGRPALRTFDELRTRSFGTDTDKEAV